PLQALSLQRPALLIELRRAGPVAAPTPGTRCSGVATGGTSLRPGRLTVSAARANVMLVIPRIARPIPPWGRVEVWYNRPPVYGTWARGHPTVLPFPGTHCLATCNG